MMLSELSEEFFSGLRSSIRDHFEIETVLGEGANGITLLVKLKHGEARFCLKTVHPKITETERFALAKSNLAKEVDILKPLQHRNLPAIVFVALDNEFPLYVCTYQPGSTFYKFKQNGHNLSLAESLFVISSLFDVVEYLHSKGRTHCDLHRDNVMIGDNVFAQGIMIIDFGSGHRLSDPSPLTQENGRIEFKAAQAQQRHNSYSHRNTVADDFMLQDFKALGVLLNFMKNIFMSHASVRQQQIFDEIAADLQNSSFTRWKEINKRLKLLVDPSYLATSVWNSTQHPDAQNNFITIPTSKPLYIGSRMEDLIASSQFQKLRGLKQLSFCDWKYPGAVHTRFEHSLGVLEVAYSALEKISDYSVTSNLVDEDDFDSFSVAAALHDIGHYPFAHVVEHYIASRHPNDQELRSETHHLNESLRIISENQSIRHIMERHNSSWTIEHIVSILKGQRGFLSKMLDNTIDIDKIDYLKRDSYHCGLSYGRSIDQDALLSAIVPSRDGHDIMFSDRYVTQVENALIMQSRMLSDVYWNPDVRAIFAMFHRFMDITIGDDTKYLRDFIKRLKTCTSESEAFEKVFVTEHTRFLKRRAAQGKPLDATDVEQIRSLVSIHGRPDPNMVYKPIAKFVRSDPVDVQLRAHVNVFNSLIQAAASSTQKSGAVAWEKVKQLRQCFVQACNEKKAGASHLDVIIDIPFGKGRNKPVRFIDEKGSIRTIEEISHVSQSIFEDISIYAAPIRIYVSPRIEDVTKNNISTIYASALEQFYDSRRQPLDDE